MKRYVDGEYIEMTLEEQAQYEAERAADSIPQIDPDAQLAINIAAATTIAGLKDALLGKNGIVRVKAIHK